MSHSYTVFCILLLAAFIGAAGCLGIGFGDVTYDGEALHVEVESSRNVTDAVLQVTLTEIGGFEQRQLFSEATYIDLAVGTNEYTVPVELAPGTYRIYLYLFIGDERGASVIRDLEV
ncbi:hypothetical protein [Methanoculleus taiwanensis]|uniref:hypothetical protein n=1 Tax=Methanoculleus taiwanensis TaxID=1550565 RepID=UPI000FFF38A3|nr:hypothetical protein [Methanoculleus taiwanensis]